MPGAAGEAYVEVPGVHLAQGMVDLTPGFVVGPDFGLFLHSHEVLSYCRGRGRYARSRTGYAFMVVQKCAAVHKNAAVHNRAYGQTACAR